MMRLVDGAEAHLAFYLIRRSARAEGAAVVLSGEPSGSYPPSMWVCDEVRFGRGEEHEHAFSVTVCALCAPSTP